MKKLIRNLGIVLLTVLYCVAISLANDTSQHVVFSQKSSSEKEKNNLSVSIKQFSNTSQAENVANPFSNSFPTTFKVSKNDFFAIVKIRELFFANEFFQYIFIARNFLIKYGKANIIFPFHYFW